MNEAQQSVQSKMQYVIDAIGKGPLSCMEEGELIESLAKIKPEGSLWGRSISLHFENPEADHTALIKDLHSQCKDDIFTMACVVGLKTAILILRSSN